MVLIVAIIGMIIIMVRERNRVLKLRHKQFIGFNTMEI